MQILDGKQLSKSIKEEIKVSVAKLKAEGKNIPHLAAILIGHNPASESYVRSKVRSCDYVGFESTLIRKDYSITEEELLEIVKELNENDDVDGFIVQLPLPKHIDEVKVTLAIDPKKDVDGFHPVNFGRMAQGLPCYLPATPYGIIQMLDRYNILTSGKHVVVVGRSNIVGTPVSILLSRKAKVGNATVTLTHSRTGDLTAELLRADIVIAAMGIPEFITGDQIKDGAVIIDVGINRVDDDTRKSGYRLVGDVEWDSVSPKASYITPVPGGVGPMTVTSLLMNTLKASANEVYG
ncbi:bifunctional 5,10-methylene-tetrahydrofolate dehydrogenase/5,10-methylene-tetrahydrofolate cyclohydrolase [Saprospiraceae bacterium]|nr:bifunctional 5,10-methylene-tetrahydrofolate dehydrogenase/5,10-methylene-tetrahydrofolate cyclohydrolase [Saprospiraceae bacterium]MDB4162675.1 bifunctional 5,10-methylene-tetrahydrofolate dehydrogenase/5,10-methylene-tetrahydrofolate cyclohydrolase [Saprospiraceae bacterium]MDB9914488.1 bifunctional 5,10-methylene-tetrahydrofolate dehydrogenase/5,10-methylene-tetrahydrofolate cyclohydrolase [Saprospiraceae bacterium]